MSIQTNRDSVLPPWGVDAGTDKQPAYTGSDVARLFSGLFNVGESPTVPLTGKLNGLKLSVSGGKVVIGEGTCLVKIGQTAGLCGLRAPVTFTPSPKHSTFDRLDRAYLLVDHASSTERGGKLAYADGQPGTDPQPPALPEGALDLGVVRVPASGQVSIVSQGEIARLNNVPDTSKTTVSFTTSDAKGNVTFYRSGNRVTAVIDNFDITFGTEPTAFSLGTNLYASHSSGYLAASRGAELYVCEIDGQQLTVFGTKDETVKGLQGTISFIDLRS